MTSMRNARQPPQVYLLGLLLFLVASVCTTSYLAIEEQNAIHQLQRYNTGADVDLSSLDYLRMETDLIPLVIGDTDTSTATARANVRFDILLDRIDELQGAAVQQVLAGHDEVAGTTDLMANTINQLRPLMVNIEVPSVAREALEILAKINPQVIRIAGLAVTLETLQTEHELNAINTLTLVLVSLTAVLIVVGGVCLIVLWKAHRSALIQIDRLNRLSHDLQQTSEAVSNKTLFLAIISHEMQTPLTAILGLAEWLSATPIQNEPRAMLQYLAQSAGTLLNLVKEILYLSRLEAGKALVEAQPANIVALVAAVYRMNRASNLHRDLNLNVYIDPAIPRWIRTDRFHITKILNNLLGNAVKFTKDGGSVAVSVTATAPTKSGSRILKIAVQDTGIGIAPEAQANIFESFAQADSTVLDRYGGTGLGLTTTRLLARALGGDAFVESAPSQGSLFWIELPLIPTEPPATDHSSRRSRVLLIGNVKNSVLLQRHLSSLGLSVEITASTMTETAYPTGRLLSYEDDSSLAAIFVTAEEQSIGLDWQARLSPPDAPVPMVAVVDTIHSDQTSQLDLPHGRSFRSVAR